jgi:rhamnopyranosyl-N-acetylglucosaminyl-diphospho-decaprenol beta-1,3/1,4-galactofuranosyltransferase
VPMPHSDLTLATVLVTHDRLDHLRITLDRLLAQPVRPVVVVDNASTDGMADRLALHRTRA